MATSIKKGRTNLNGYSLLEVLQGLAEKKAKKKRSFRCELVHAQERNRKAEESRENLHPGTFTKKEKKYSRI